MWGLAAEQTGSHGLLSSHSWGDNTDITEQNLLQKHLELSRSGESKRVSKGNTSMAEGQEDNKMEEDDWVGDAGADVQPMNDCKIT